MLNEKDFQKFQEILKKASLELGSTKLTFEWEWTYFLPTQSLQIDGCVIDHKYEVIRMNYGSYDLTRLVEIGFLEFIEEIKGDPIAMEKTIHYRIIQ